MKNCYYCKETFDDTECRPYAPGKADTCFPCAMKPENRPTTDALLQAQIDEALELGNGNVFIGHHMGPIPMSNKDVGNN